MVAPDRRTIAISVALGLFLASTVAVAQPWTVGTVEDACGSPSFPCTYELVDDSVLNRGHELVHEIAQRAAAGDEKRVIHDWLADQDGVVDVHTDLSSVRFRLAGGRGVWVRFSNPTGKSRGGPLTFTPTLRLAAPQVGGGGGMGGEIAAVVGDNGTPGKKTTKKALVLSPFSWDFDHGVTQEHTKLKEYFENATVGGLKSDVRIYPDGDVHVIANTYPLDNEGRRDKSSKPSIKVDLGSFANWDAYDVIHVATHGSGKCDGKSCVQTLSTGIPFSKNEHEGLEKIDHAEEAYAITTAATLPDGVTRSKNGTTGPFLDLRHKWFVSKYQQPLEDKIIFLNACESWKAKGDRVPAIIKVLKGDKTLVAGWTASVDNQIAAAAARRFWYAHLIKGKKVKDALKTLKSTAKQLSKAAGQGYVEPKLRGEAASYEEAALAGGNAEFTLEGELHTRAREIIGFYDPYTRKPIHDGYTLTPEGSPGDGKHDSLLGTIELIGIGEDEDPTNYEIRVRFNGKLIDETYFVDEEKSEGIWRAKVEIPLGEDLDPDERYMLDLWADLGDGGETRWVYEDLAFEHLYFDISGTGFSGVKRIHVLPSRVKPTLFRDLFVVDMKKDVFHDYFRGPFGLDWVLLTVKDRQQGTYPLGDRASATVRGIQEAHIPSCGSHKHRCRLFTAKEVDGSITIADSPPLPENANAALYSGEVSGTFEFTGTDPVQDGASWDVKGSFRVKAGKRNPR